MFRVMRSAEKARDAAAGARGADPSSYRSDLATATGRRLPASMAAELRRHTNAVEKLARDGADVSREVRRFTAAIDDLARAEAKALAKEAMAARWAARVRAMVMSESVGAFSDAFKSTTAKVPGVVGYRWNLGGAHRVPDICDDYAGRDGYGMGSGGYPTDSVPALPPHPGCFCYLTAIEGK